MSKKIKSVIYFPNKKLPFSNNILTKDTLEVFQENENKAERVFFRLNSDGTWVQETRYSLDKNTGKVIKKLIK